jgi:hypothetical protein
MLDIGLLYLPMQIEMDIRQRKMILLIPTPDQGDQIGRMFFLLDYC